MGGGELTRMSRFVTLGIAASPAVRAGLNLRAEVAELADAHGSGPCTRKGVGVRVPSSAPGFLFPSVPIVSLPRVPVARL